MREYHPIHAVYISTQNLVSYLAEILSVLPELKDYCNIIESAEEEYMPQGPPFSPLTTSFETLQKGTVNQSVVYPRDVVKSSVEQNACAVIFVHNHPGGSLKPSQMDMEITEKLINACSSVDIQVLDHIIISPYRAYKHA